jgi:hypothetical protein
MRALGVGRVEHSLSRAAWAGRTDGGVDDASKKTKLLVTVLDHDVSSEHLSKSHLEF